MCGGGRLFPHLPLPVAAAVAGVRDTVRLLSPKTLRWHPCTGSGRELEKGDCGLSFSPCLGSASELEEEAGGGAHASLSAWHWAAAPFGLWSWLMTEEVLSADLCLKHGALGT